MTTLKLRSYKNKAAKLARANGLKYVAIFGSRARSDHRKNSDIDIMIDYIKPVGLIKYIQMRKQFTSVFGHQVDLITKRSLSGLLKPFITKNMITLYEKN